MYLVLHATGEILDEFFEILGFSGFLQYIGAKTVFETDKLQIFLSRTSILFDINKGYLCKTKYMVYSFKCLIYIKIAFDIRVNNDEFVASSSR